MTLYFIDGKIDCFETSKVYSELENAYSIEAADGVSACYDQLIDLESEAGYKKNYVIVSNFLPFLDLADEIYIYNNQDKMFRNWNDIKFKFTPNNKSKMEIYLCNI